LRLAAPLVLRSIAPRRMPEGASARVIARLPDSRLEPLLWIYNFKPKFAHAYTYREALRLPAGTVIEVLCDQPAAILLSAAPSPAP
jgi:hypothetical protein